MSRRATGSRMDVKGLAGDCSTGVEPRAKTWCAEIGGERAVVPPLPFFVQVRAIEGQANEKGECHAACNARSTLPFCARYSCQRRGDFCPCQLCGHRCSFCKMVELHVGACRDQARRYFSMCSSPKYSLAKCRLWRSHTTLRFSALWRPPAANGTMWSS